ncbi:hypothetical protein HZC21_00735 [Candidatus Peregrinibacteria bacterium]|nr:hypothetical protein [Candidatus Peregrinibacteria bacterium]
MKNTPERTEPVSRQPETVRPASGMLSNLKHSIAARLTALLAALTPAAAIGCGGETEKTEKAAKPAEIPECMQPENLDAPAPCVTPGKYLWESNRLTVYFDVPEYNELCLNPLEVTVLGDTWTDKGDGTTDLNPMQELEGVKWVYDSDDDPKKPDDFVTAEVPAGSDLSGFALLTTDARGEQCVSDTTATSTMPTQ